MSTDITCTRQVDSFGSLLFSIIIEKIIKSVKDIKGYRRPPWKCYVCADNALITESEGDLYPNINKANKVDEVNGNKYKRAMRCKLQVECKID